jgi:acyl carrier protein
MLAQIWSEVLSLDKVGIHDNFFELGGHSLMVIQVLSRLRETVQVELSMSDFFERPTIVTMAELVEATLVEEIGELSEEEAESLASSAG